jgi:hypothetical protein
LRRSFSRIPRRSASSGCSRIEDEGLRVAIESAVAGHRTAVVDAVCPEQLPAAVVGKQVVEVRSLQVVIMAGMIRALIPLFLMASIPGNSPYPGYKVIGEIYYVGADDITSI